MGVMGDTQRQGFMDRLDRIHVGGPNTSGTIYAGALDAGGETVQKKRRKKRLNIGTSGLIFWPFALVIGALSMLAGRIGAYHALQTPDLIPPQYAALFPLLGDITIAMVLMISFAWAFHLWDGMRKVFLCAGLVGVMMSEPLIIQQAPDLFRPLFSDSYVTAALAGEAPIETAQITWKQLSSSRVFLPIGPFGG